MAVSVEVAALSLDMKHVDYLCKAADQALYQAKQDERDSVQVAGGH